MDGALTQAEALGALSAAALAATQALPGALLRCETREQMQHVIADRDACQLAYTTALARSLFHTGPLFEQAADELQRAARAVAKSAQKQKTAAEAVGLLADLVRLSSKLALAFV
jgi:hypothetical protein